MLNPPLSLLSNELLALIVEHLAALPYTTVRDLSLADRAFTPICQKLIFRTLQIGRERSYRINIPYQLEKYQTILNGKPEAANQVRFLRLFLVQKKNEWVLNNPTFIRILDLISKSPSPPDKLQFKGFWSMPIENPVLFVDVLAKSCFSQSLRSLHLSECKNLPLLLLLLCPRLQLVNLEKAAVTDENYDRYPDDQCAREWPSLQVFRYRDSHSFVKQMITPPPRFQAPVALWSQLRILKLCPFVEMDLACLQPILDAACNSLEELDLAVFRAPAVQIPLAGLVNLTNLSNLRVFSLVAVIEGDASLPPVLQDINTVLSRILSPNKITNMFFDFSVYESEPFRVCLGEDWAGLCQQIIRIAADKPVELDLQWVSRGVVAGESSLFTAIYEKVASLSDSPNICTHFWDYILGQQGLKAFHGGVRTRCKR